MTYCFDKVTNKGTYHREFMIQKHPLRDHNRTIPRLIKCIFSKILECCINFEAKLLKQTFNCLTHFKCHYGLLMRTFYTQCKMLKKKFYTGESGLLSNVNFGSHLDEKRSQA